MRRSFENPKHKLKFIGKNMFAIYPHSVLLFIFSNEDYVGSRVQQLDPLPNPPQKTDPRDFDEMPGGYYTNTKVTTCSRVNSGNFEHKVSPNIHLQTVEIQMRRL